MTTRLKGKETHFLPFNRGNNHGAGNPPVEGNWKTHYLWDEVLQVDSLLDILQRFMHLEVKEKQVKTDKGVRTVRKETMIFPRYHQLDAGVGWSGRRTGAQCLESAGSGKEEETTKTAAQEYPPGPGQKEGLSQSATGARRCGRAGLSTGGLPAELSAGGGAKANYGHPRTGTAL